jgi:hypothetical protein
MMEYWNVDFEKKVLTFKDPSLQCQKGYQITQCTIVPKPIIPPFHYSNIPVVSEAN